MNALQLCRLRFSHKKLYSRLSSKKVQFLHGKRPFGVLAPFVYGLGTTKDVHLGLTISVNWTFSSHVMAETLRENVDWKPAFLLEWGQFDLKCQVQEFVPH